MTTIVTTIKIKESSNYKFKKKMIEKKISKKVRSYFGD